MKMGAVIVTFNPNLDRLYENIKAMNKQVDFSYIVDNYSDNRSSIEQLALNFKNVRLIKLERNFGIAKAQNVGFSRFYLNH